MDIAIDLGSGRTRVFTSESGKLLDEASVVAFDIDTREIYEYGDRAYRMIGKTPFGITAAHPIENGVIAHSDLAAAMVSEILRTVTSSRVVMPRIVSAVPCGVTEVEKRAVVNAVSSFGARRVFLIESPLAAALGCGIDITSPHGILIADLGAGTADIAVVSLGGTAVSKSVFCAGKKMDEEIVKYVRKKYNLIIGSNMAEACKLAIGCVKAPAQESFYRVKGRDALSGLPSYADVTSSEIKSALEETAAELVRAIRDVLEKAPPELISDIYTDGIILTGGLAKLGGLARLISEKTRLRVRVHKTSADCVINGCGRAIDYIDKPPEGAQGISPLFSAY